MKFIIPAAGRGSRLRPHTYSVPKVLLPVAGKPILGHILDQIIAWGGTEVTIVVHHLEDLVESYVSDNYNLKVEFRHQEELLGLGHAVMTGLNPDDEEVVIILGDTILNADLKSVFTRGISAMGVKEVKDPRKLGVVVLKDGKVERLIEKPIDPPSKLAIVGVYYLHNGGLLHEAIQDVIAKNITVKGEYQITDALQRMINLGETIQTFPVSGWYDCGKPETLLATNRHLLDRQDNIVKSNNYPNSLIIQPVSIGKNVEIENSVIGPYVSIGDGSKISYSLIENTIIGERAKVDQCLLKESLIGTRGEVQGHFRNLNIGASNQIEL
jgi:glucose-1-phosphate thymidylyltransferase